MKFLISSFVYLVVAVASEAATSLNRNSLASPITAYKDRGFKPAYDITRLSVPSSTACSAQPAATELGAATGLPCVRAFIDTIDLQIAYLLAHRSDFALLAGTIKHAKGQPLDAPARNVQVADRYAELVKFFGSSSDLGKTVAITVVAANLKFEEEVIGTGHWKDNAVNSAS